MPVQFNTDPDFVRQARIAAARAHAMKLTDDKVHTQMDLQATDANGCKLDLEKLLAFDDFNFTHDIAGIARHIDRDDNSPTGGQLLRHFLPRCAA